MEFEVDFYPVGDESTAGDAIVVRCAGNNVHYVYVIDGGTISTGEKIVEDLRALYGNGVIVADVVSTHPDKDHASGLRVILEELDVRFLRMHRPWAHASWILPLFSDKRWTIDGLGQRIREGYRFAAELEEIALRKKINIVEPFAGQKIGPFTVLSPDQAFYQYLIPQFDSLPEADEQQLKSLGVWVGRRPIRGLLAKAFTSLLSVFESFSVETLRDSGITSATNESSVVLFGDFEESKCLLTADAGRYALARAMFYARNNGINLQEVRFFQIPHHGSRSNVSPAILNEMLGPRQTLPGVITKYAVASCPESDAKHPRKIVLNAYLRRGAKWDLTQGKHIYWHKGEWRKGLIKSETPKIFSEVEEYD